MKGVSFILGFASCYLFLKFMNNASHGTLKRE